ncbi:hypothetical protein PFISCL1PPCAC_25929, partial [Pristionchus fissidentatus]
KIIDVPTPVRLPAICSINSNIECALKKDLKKHDHRNKLTVPCRNDQVCEDVESWNSETISQPHAISMGRWLPKDECSDFEGKEMYSNTLAIRKGKIIDVPTPVRLPAICSINSNIECALKKDLKKHDHRNKLTVPCRNDQVCEDVESWNSETISQPHAISMGRWLPKDECSDFEGKEMYSNTLAIRK